MTAKSPYAPPRRNSYLRRNSSSSFSSAVAAASAVSTSSNTTGSKGGNRSAKAALVGFLWFIVKFWRDVPQRQKLWDLIQRKPGIGRVVHWIQHQIAGIQSSSSSKNTLLGYLPFFPQNNNDNDNNSKNHLPPTTTIAIDEDGKRKSQRISILSTSDDPHHHQPRRRHRRHGKKKLNNKNKISQVLEGNERSCSVGGEEEESVISLCSSSSSSSTTSMIASGITNKRIQRICNNQEEIRSVLQFWFGQYPPSTAPKMLWMIANSSTQLQERVDEEITTQFQMLLLELSSLSTGGGAAAADDGGGDGNDNGVGNGGPSRKWAEWCLDRDGLYGPHGKIAAIIVLDQFSRHMARHHQHYNLSGTNSINSNNNNNNNNNKDVSLPLPPLPNQSELDSLALQTAQLLMEKHSTALECGMIPLPMYIFSLMPYRHANTLESYKFVQQCIEQCASQTEQMDAMLRRFRKATNRRMALLQDEARRKGKLSSMEEAAAPLPSSASTSSSPIGDNGLMNNGGTGTGTDVMMGGDGSCATNTTLKSSDGLSLTASSHKIIKEEDILETFPFQADMSSVTLHPVYKTVVSFLAERGIHPISSNSTSGTGTKSQKSSPKKQMIKKNKKNGNKDKNTVISSTSTSHSNPVPILISLSGGVDSMVILSVLAHIHASGEFPSIQQVVAVHIDYANRPESGAEAAYVEQYSNSLGVTFSCTRIEQVTRGITARDEYERISRDVRYDSYRQAIERATTSDGSSTTTNNGGAENDDKDDDDNKCVEIGVMLGHHRGDLRENVLSNAHKGCGPLDLSGMTRVSRNNGITIYRPLLPLEKTAILDYAHRYGVPYFKDTTPHWSTRGKLRNKLLPLLEEIYGEGSMNNLSALAEESDSCRSMIHKVLIGPFMDQVVRKPMGIIFVTAPWKTSPIFFWKFVLRETLHSAGLGMFSDKSVLSFLERVQADPVRPGWLQCRKDYAVYLQADGRVYVFYPSSFPFRKEDQYPMDSRVVEYGQSIQIGPWTVHSELVQTPEAQDYSRVVSETLLAQKAVPSMDHLMEGEIEYHLIVPTSLQVGVFVPQPLVLCPEFTKSSRPVAWKSTDLKIQSTLPILGTDETAAGTKPILKQMDLTLLHNLATFDVTTIPQENPDQLAKVVLSLEKKKSSRFTVTPIRKT